MSKIKTLQLANAVKGLTVVASKVSIVSGDGADEGSVTILNCNINSSNNNESKVIKKDIKASDYRISGNSLENFDLYFLQLDCIKSNMLCQAFFQKYFPL